jgi:hypothetical protein
MIFSFKIFYLKRKAYLVQFFAAIIVLALILLMFLFVSKCLKKIKLRRRRRAEANVMNNQRVNFILPRQSSLPNYEDIYLNVNNRLSFENNVRQINEKEEASPPPYPGI